MLKSRWFLSLPLVFAAALAPARAATIRDNAGMFDPSAVQQASRELDRVEAKYDLPVTIETIPSLDGRAIHEVLQDHARAARAEGLYVLISKQDHRIEADVSGAFKRALPAARTRRIWEPMSAEFRKGSFNDGLTAGVRAIDSEAAAAKSEYGSLRQGPAGQRRAAPPAFPGAGRPANRGTFGMGTLLGIGLLVIAVLIGIRLLGALFGAGRGYYGPGRMGGPGYGGPGYGGGGGGFMSGMFGGLGGALMGNWLYDQFSGRHHGGYVENTSYGQPDPGTPAAPDNNDWSGSGGSWDDGGGGGGGGGDWGGGGGGDWGGGGGDWGGGGDGGGDGGGW